MGLDIIAKLKFEGREFADGIKKSADASKKFGGVWEGISKHFVITAGDIVRGLRAVTGRMVDMIKRGGDVGDVMANTSLDIGQASAAVRGLVSNYDLASKANAATEAGLRLTTGQFNALSKAAVIMGQRTGRDASAAFDQLLSSVIAAESRGLKQFGIALDAVNPKLSAQEQLLARQSQAVGKFVERYGDAVVQTDDAGEALTQASVAWTNLTDALSLWVAENETVIGGLTATADLLRAVTQGGLNYVDVLNQITNSTEAFVHDQAFRTELKAQKVAVNDGTEALRQQEEALEFVEGNMAAYLRTVQLASEAEIDFQWAAESVMGQMNEEAAAAAAAAAAIAKQTGAVREQSAAVVDITKEWRSLETVLAELQAMSADRTRGIVPDLRRPEEVRPVPLDVLGGSGLTVEQEIEQERKAIDDARAARHVREMEQRQARISKLNEEAKAFRAFAQGQFQAGLSVVFMAAAQGKSFAGTLKALAQFAVIQAAANAAAAIAAWVWGNAPQAAMAGKAAAAWGAVAALAGAGAGGLGGGGGGSSGGARSLSTSTPIGGGSTAEQRFGGSGFASSRGGGVTITVIVPPGGEAAAGRAVRRAMAAADMEDGRA